MSKNKTSSQRSKGTIMSEAQQANACNNAGGDSAEVHTNGLPDAPAPVCQRPEQPAVQVAAPAAGGDGQPQQPLPEKDDNANTKETAEPNNNNATAVQQLQEDLVKRTTERDDFRKKLEETERKLTALQCSALANGSTANTTTTVSDSPSQRELDELRQTLTKTKLALDERERRVATQDSQIGALGKQVSSLKEVVAITKDMLSIRNMEVKHLQEDVDKMEARIAAERERHSAMLNKMEAAVRLNADLKKEYQTQLQLFQDLRGKYEEKVTLLSEENKALESAVQAQPAQ